MHLGQPEDCPDHVYKVMKSCWHKDSSERPNFTMIAAQLKQEVTLQDGLPEASAKSPVHGKEPLYQNTAVSPDVFQSKFIILPYNMIFLAGVLLRGWAIFCIILCKRKIAIRCK